SVVTNGTNATLHISYRCTSTPPPMSHLFAAVKQGDGVSPEHSSSEDPAVHLTSFLSTNWSVDSGPNAVLCDGKTHHQVITLKDQVGEEPGQTFGSAPVKTGPVLVQLCLFDSNGTLGASYTMQRAVATGKK